VFDLTMRAIQASLDGLAARQRLTAENIANAEVPGYLASRVDFESSLREAIEGGDFSDLSMSTTTSLAPTGLNGPARSGRGRCSTVSNRRRRGAS